MAVRTIRPAPGIDVAATAWLAGPVAVGLGAVAHLVSGAAPPPALIVAALVALTSLCATVLVRLRVPGWALFLASGLAQQGLHLAFTALSGSTSGGNYLAHGHTGALKLPTEPGALAIDMHTGELLLYTHTAAALLTVALLVVVGKVVGKVVDKTVRRTSLRSMGASGGDSLQQNDAQGHLRKP